MGHLIALTRLWLKNVGVVSVPGCISWLPALREPHIDGNGLDLLQELGNLAGLTWLGLSALRATSLTDSISQLTALRHLELL